MKSVWPKIVEAVPSAELAIVGDILVDERQRWRSLKNVKLYGFVDNISEQYDNCAFTVAPIYSGGGSSIKILKSLAHGRACVATSFALHAFQPHLNGKNFVIAESDQDMEIQCIRLLRESTRRRQFAEAGHAVVSAAFDYEGFRQSVKEQVDLSVSA